MMQKKEDRWIDNIFDGIIAALQIAEITEQDLLELWKIASKQFKINLNAKQYDNNNNLNKIYISDFHYAISLCSQRLGYLDIECKLQKIAPTEYNQKRLDCSEHNRIIPNRWFAPQYAPDVMNFINETEEMNSDEIFTHLQTKVNSGKNISWNIVQYFLIKVKMESPERMTIYKTSILNMLNTRKKDYTIEFDGSNNTYEELFPYMSDKEIDTVLNRIIETYSYCKEIGFQSSEYGLMTDLDHFTFFLLGNYDFNENIKALNELLKMHCMWLCGTETFTLNK